MTKEYRKGYNAGFKKGTQKWTKHLEKFIRKEFNNLSVYIPALQKSVVHDSWVLKILLSPKVGRKWL